MLSKLCSKLALNRSLPTKSWRLLSSSIPQAKLSDAASSQANAGSVEEAPRPAAELAGTASVASGEQLGHCVVGLFSGKINPNLLVYPELDTMEDVEAVHRLGESVEKFIADHIDSSELDTTSQLSPEHVSGLRSLGLFGQAAPENLGGLDLSHVAQARLAEATSADAGVELTLRAHNCLALRTLLAAASPEQLQRLGGPLARGEKLAALCLSEPGGGGGFSDPRASVRATAALDEDGLYWRLNGCKVWVTNGPTADVFLVFALTTVQSDGPLGASGSRELISAFLVERDSPGVTVGPPEAKLGARAAATGALHLTNARIPTANLLGQPGDGLRLARQAATWSRLSSGAAVAGSLKRQLAGLAVRCAARRPGGEKPLAELPLVQRRLARLSGLVYATESVAYQLAFLADRYPDADLSSEAAALSLLSSRAAITGAVEAAIIAGGGRACAAGGDGGFPFERGLRDAWTLMCADSPADMVRLQLAGRGIKIAAKEASGAAFKFVTARGILDKMRVMKAQSRFRDGTQPLAVHYHHNLAGVANGIEVSATSFASAVRYCLFYYKTDLPKEQMFLCRMADCAVDLFTLLSCCARASRSKSIGLRSADQEIDLVVMLSKESTLRLDHNISGLNIDTVFARHPDAEFRRISDFACKFGGYSIDHAISRNWN